MFRGIVFLFTVGSSCLLSAWGQVVGHLPEFLPRYKLVARFAGGMVDQSSGSVLLQSHGGAIERFDIESKTLFPLGTNYGNPRYLIPNGFLLYATNGLLQIEGNEEINLGPVNVTLLDHGTRAVEGRFGVLRTEEGRVLRDFVARTNLLLSTSDGFVDVSANGSVAYTELQNGTNIAIRWFHDGEFETLANLPGFPLPHVSTDGTNVIWSEPNTPFGSVFLQTPTNRIELATNTFVAENGWQPEAPQRTSVAMKGGWMIFPQWAPGNPGTLNNLWRRSPEGEITQLTTKVGFVLAMAEDGGAIIEGGDGRIQSGLYYIPAKGEAKPLGDGYPLARYFAVGNKFYAYSPLQSSGSGLYEIEVEEDPFGLVYPRYDFEKGKFVVGIHPGMPGTFVLERTVDLVEWTVIETIVAEGVYVVDVEVATPPGIFRLRKL